MKTVKDYSHEYSDPAFAGGLDELRAEAFPRNRVVLSGWIWGSEDQLKDFQIVVYKIKDKKKPTEKDKRDNMFSARTAQTIAEDGGSEVLTYRNVAAEHPELAGRFGLELNLDGYGQFKSGTTYRLEICLRDNTGRAEDDLRIGIYEITLQDGAAGAGVSAEEIAAGWDNRTGE